MTARTELTLDCCRTGQTGVIVRIEACGQDMTQRMAEMGIFEGNRVRVIGFAPLGCPMMIEIFDSIVAIRKCHTKLITIALD